MQFGDEPGVRYASADMQVGTNWEFDLFLLIRALDNGKGLEGEPVLDGKALVGMTIGGNDRIAEVHLGDRAPEHRGGGESMVRDSEHELQTPFILDSEHEL